MFDQDVPAHIKTILNIIALFFFLPFLLYATFQAMTLVSRATGSNANIIINSQAVTNEIDPSFMHAFAQGGGESVNMIEPIKDSVRALRPRYIRIDHIFDSYGVVSKKNGQITFDFSKLDAYVQSITDTGAVPLFALSYMPPDLSADGTVIGVPTNWPDWSLVVQKTIEHYSGKTQKNMKNVYYEVWNEPDHPQFGGWKIGGAKDYVTLYRYSQVGAERAQNCQPFSFGGPATTGLYKNWILGLIKNGLRVDFFSWHTYLDDPTRFSKDFTNLNDWLRPYPRYMITPRLITEFGFTGARDARYGLSYASAFTLSVFRQLLDAPPQYAFSFQLKDSLNDTDGKGWGLITHDSNGLTKKPRYYAYPFIDKIIGKRIPVVGEGTWVTAVASRSKTTIKVLLINFDPSGYHSEATPVTITNLPPGTYDWRLQYLFSNLYRKEGCVSAKTNATAVDITQNRTWKQTICIAAQNAAIVELTPR